MSEPQRRQADEQPRPAHRPRRKGTASLRPVEDDEPIRDTVRETLSDTEELIRNEIRLARTEIESDLKGLMVASAWLTGASLAAFFGAFFILLAPVLAPSRSKSRGSMSLLVGFTNLLLGGMLGWMGWQRLKEVNPVPERTIDTLEEDAEWLRNRTR